MSEINLSRYLEKAAKSMIASPSLQAIKLNAITFFIRKSVHPKRVATITGKNNLPSNLRFANFPSNALYLLYFDWPGFFQLDMQEKAGILFVHLTMCAETFDGVLSDRHPSWRQSSPFMKWYSKNQNLLFKNPVFSLKAKELERRYKITGDVYRPPAVVRK